MAAAAAAPPGHPPPHMPMPYYPGGGWWGYPQHPPYLPMAHAHAQAAGMMWPPYMYAIGRDGSMQMHAPMPMGDGRGYALGVPPAALSRGPPQASSSNPSKRSASAVYAADAASTRDTVKRPRVVHAPGDAPDAAGASWDNTGGGGGGFHPLSADVDTEETAEQVRSQPHATSRYRGVSLARSGHWRVQVGFMKKRLSVGHFPFEDEREAARAYDCTVRLLHGATGVLNFPRESIAIDDLPPTFAESVRRALRSAVKFGWTASRDVVSLLRLEAVDDVVVEPAPTDRTEDRLAIVGSLLALDSRNSPSDTEALPSGESLTPEDTDRSLRAADTVPAPSLRGTVNVSGASASSR